MFRQDSQREFNESSATKLAEFIQHISDYNYTVPENKKL